MLTNTAHPLIFVTLTVYNCALNAQDSCSILYRDAIYALSLIGTNLRLHCVDSFRRKIHVALAYTLIAGEVHRVT